MAPGLKSGWKKVGGRRNETKKKGRQKTTIHSSENFTRLLEKRSLRRGRGGLYLSQLSQAGRLGRWLTDRHIGSRRATQLRKGSRMPGVD